MEQVIGKPAAGQGNGGVAPDCGEGWVNGWFGYRRHVSTLREEDSAQARQEEIGWFKKIASVLPESPTFMEVGAGWGAWCLAMAGLKEKPKLVAVEAIAAYVGLTKRHLWGQGVPAEILHFAVADYEGYCRFNTDFIPFGQGLTYSGWIYGSRVLAVMWGLLHLLLGKTERVRVITIEKIMQEMKLERLDFLQMDIQGAEVKAIKGTPLDRVNYIMLGTHHRNIHSEITSLLWKTHDLIADIKPVANTDGLMVWRRHE